MEGRFAKLTEAYWTYVRSGVGEPYLARPGRPDLEWASDDVRDTITSGGGRAVALVEALAAAAPHDELALASLGAGPLEDLVRLHGFDLMDELDAALDRVPRLREAVQYVRVGVEDLPADVSFRRFYLGRGAAET